MTTFQKIASSMGIMAAIGGFVCIFIKAISLADQVNDMPFIVGMTVITAGLIFCGIKMIEGFWCEG